MQPARDILLLAAEDAFEFERWRGSLALPEARVGLYPPGFCPASSCDRGTGSESVRSVS